MIIRGTTPTVSLDADRNYIGYPYIVVTFEDRTGTEVDVVGPGPDLSVTPSQVMARLTQEQTLALEAGKIKIQIRAIDSTGQAVADTVKNDVLEDVLKDGVISAPQQRFSH